MSFVNTIKKRVISLLTVSGLILSTFAEITAEIISNNSNETETVYSGDEITKDVFVNVSDSFFGEINWDQTVVINGSEVDLLAEYVDPEKSLQIAYEYAYDLINALQQDFDLDDFSDATWEEYMIAMVPFEFDKESKYNWKTIGKMMQFFDFYENSEINDEIRKSVYENDLEKKSSSKNMDQELTTEIIGKLPIYSHLGLSKDNPSFVSPQSGISNLTNVINYASSCATSPNSAYTYSNGQDCTNFASQINYSSGSIQTSCWNPYTTSWINADSFAR